MKMSRLYCRKVDSCLECPARERRSTKIRGALRYRSLCTRSMRWIANGEPVAQGRVPTDLEEATIVESYTVAPFCRLEVVE